MDEMQYCCGLPMVYHEVFGIRIYQCDYRPGHERRYLSLISGLFIHEFHLEDHRQLGEVDDY